MRTVVSVLLGFTFRLQAIPASFLTIKNARKKVFTLKTNQLSILKPSKATAFVIFQNWHASCDSNFEHIKKNNTKVSIMIRNILIVLALSLIAGESAFANDLSYTNIRFGAVSGDISDRNLTGLSLKASLALNKNIFVQSTYNELELKLPTAEFERLLLGAGYSLKLTNNIDFQTTLSYVVTGTELSNSEGYEAALGFRSKPYRSIEFGIETLYVDVGAAEGEVGYTLSTRWIANNIFSLGLLYRQVDNVNTAVLDIGVGF